MMTTPPFAIETRNIFKDYPLPSGGQIRALAPLSLRVAPAASLVILGGAAAGKTTLLGLLSGRIRPTGGSIRYAPGFEPEAGRANRGLDWLQDGRATLAQALARSGVFPRQAGISVGDWLDTLSLSALQERPIRTLSSGERARVELAGMLLQPAPLLLLDDPSALDAGMAARLRPLLAALIEQEGVTLVLSTHIPAVALELCERSERILVLRAGRLVEDLSNPSCPPVSRGDVYTIRVRGRLSPTRSDWFGGLDVRLDGDDTLLTGPVADAAALYGLLERARDLGLQLISVQPAHSGRLAALDEKMGIV